MNITANKALQVGSLAALQLAPEVVVDEGRLACAVRPQEPEDRAARHVEVDALQGVLGGCALARRVGLLKAARGDRGGEIGLAVGQGPLLGMARRVD